jgi:hypothetical protein
VTWPPGPPGSGGRATFNHLEPRVDAHRTDERGRLFLVPAARAEGARPRPAGLSGGERRAGATVAPAIAPQPSPSPPATSSRAAVLVESGLRTLGAGIVAPISDSAAVVRLAGAMGVRQIWVGPKMAERIGPWGPWLQAARADGWELVSGQSSGWLELRRGEAHVEIALPGGHPFESAPNGVELLKALDLLAGALRLRYRYSPGATGLALMRAVHSGPGGIPLPETGTPAPPALEPADWLTAGSWLVDELPDSRWIHAYDVNGMYLAACSSIELGFGVPVHRRSSDGLAADALLPRIGGLRIPGFYRASVRLARRLPLGHTPLPFVVDGRRHWYPGPALELLEEIGARVSVSEAWVYPERHRWLEPWYVRLRDARAALAGEEPAATLAREAVKRVYTASLGRLAGSWMAVGDAAFRPDWRAAVMARAGANLVRHVAKVQAHSGALPLGQDADLLLYASELEDPLEAAAALGLELSPQLGKFKPAGSCTGEEARAGAAVMRPGLEVRGVLAQMGARR